MHEQKAPSFDWVIALACAVVALALLLAPTGVSRAATEAPAASPSAAGAQTPQSTPEAAPAPSFTPKPELYSDLIIKPGDEGDAVISLQMRLRDLGYFPYKITGEFGSWTRQAVVDFQEDNGLNKDGVVGGRTASLLYANGATRSLSNRRIPTPTPRPTPAPTKKPSSKTPKNGKLIEWSEANRLAPRGSYMDVIDFYTGRQYRVYRMGGSNHMDVEPVTKNDTAQMKASMGGSWTWVRRPLLVKIKGTWYAASLYGEPHGQQTIKNNNMQGQVCIHFLNSRTHGTNIKDPDHQRMIKKAAGK
ncbi:MAG: peptidoglycan-binding protein [Christensenellaceae bacterium]|jgi:peptidoglycan hydrolase-like protein with peptidoglycan-binding domain|nr:peptidoglycan-binding protein [Christensenellaceae bacterium]